MRFSRNITILLIVLLIIIGITGTYFLMNWTKKGYFNFRSTNQTTYSDNELKNYLSQSIKDNFGNGFQIADIFVFTNTPYYVSVVEKDNGRGAFELLFDPDTKVLQAEQGPNMMWNEKYGMMGNRGWMGIRSRFMGDNQPETNQVSRQEALKDAQQYLDRNRKGIEVINDGHEFYGYYTFHTVKDGKPYGMLSVNAITGEVWYHDWHGKLDRIIEVEHHGQGEEA